MGQCVYSCLLPNYFRDEALEEPLGSILLIFHKHHKHAVGTLCNARFGFSVCVEACSVGTGQSEYSLWDRIPVLGLRL